MFSAAKTAAPSGTYTISRSVRLRSSASAYFNRTFGSPTGSNTFTWSGWVKRGTLGVSNWIFNPTDVNGEGISFNSSNQLSVARDGAFLLVSNSVYRDPSAWYHIVLASDMGNATASLRCRVYVNGVEITSWATDARASYTSFVYWNKNTVVHQIGYNSATPAYSDLYHAEVNFIDGQALTPSSFGAYNTTTGVWQPKKYTGTYGTNGFYLNFSNTTYNSPAGIGQDFSGTSSTAVVGTTTSGSNSMTVVSLTGISVGNIITGAGIPAGTYVTAASVLTVTMSNNATSSNTSVSYTFSGNNWTPNNISLTAGTTYDSMTDVPTLTSATAANYCVMNPLDNQATLSNGNLTQTTSTAERGSRSTFAIPDTGLWYAEAVVTSTTTAATISATFGLATSSVSLSASGYNTAGIWGMYSSNFAFINRNGTPSSSLGVTLTAGDVVQVAVDIANGRAWIGRNNTWYDSGTGTTGNPSAGTNPTVTSLPSGLFVFANGYSQTLNVNFGQRPFAYTAPTGFVALNTYNLPTSTIVNGAQYMAATTYNGTGAIQTINNGSNTTIGTTFQPDFVWIKSRSNGGYWHALMDSIRGPTKILSSNTTGADVTLTDELTSFNSNGFSLGVSSTGYTNNSGTYVGWQWKAAGSSSSNTSGTITSTVNAGTTQGFSVVTYTGTGSAGTVGHGLGVAPKFIIIKSRSNSDNWYAYHASIGNTSAVFPNLTTAATANSAYFNNTSPTSSVFSIGTIPSQSAWTYVAYAFAEVAGFSKFGSYTGNGTTDGPFVYCGFRPRFLMIKRTDTTGDWVIVDTSRNPSNLTTQELYPDLSNAEGSSTNFDLLSNGFKLRGFAGYVGANGGTYIYAAFAENPTKFALAR